MEENALTHALNTGHKVIGATLYQDHARHERWLCSDCGADGHSVDLFADWQNAEQ